MTRGGYRAGKSSARGKVASHPNMPSILTTTEDGKSSAKSKLVNHAKMPSIPTAVADEGGTSSLPTSMATVTGQTILPSSTPVIQTTGKSSSKSKVASRTNIPSVPAAVIEQGGKISIPNCIPPVQTSSKSAPGKSLGRSITPQQITSQILLHNNIPNIQISGQSTIPATPITLGTSPVTNIQSNPTAQGASTQSNPIVEGASNQSNITGEVDSSANHAQTLIFLTSSGLEPSTDCSSFITYSFRSELDPNGINWKGVSEEVKDSYFGEFKKNFYWDSSISDAAIKKQWLKKAAKCYRNFISKLKRIGVQERFVNDHVWESWMQLWGSDECVKKSEINAKNRRAGSEVAAGTHTGGSITIGDHRKKLAVQLGREPTPSELHLHVHTHGHDGKSFVGDRSRLVHEKYEEIVREKIQSESDIDHCEAYYQAAGGVKKRRIYGLGSEGKAYYGTSFCASSSVPTSISQLASVPNLDEFVKQLVPRLIPAITEQILPIVMERIGKTQEVETPIVPDIPTTTNDDDEEVES